MPQKQLRHSLAELRSEIDNIEAIDDESRARLNQVVDQVQQKIDSPDEADHHNLVGSLDDSVRHFEVTHPNITEALNKVMVALSNIGI